jgi:hypothetical protein
LCLMFNHFIILGNDTIVKGNCRAEVIYGHHENSDSYRY